MQSLVDTVWRASPRLVTPLFVLLVTAAAGWLAASLTFRWLHRWATKTSTALDDILLRSIQAPVRLWVLILAVALAARSASLPPQAAVPLDRALLILWIISLTLAASRLATDLLRHYGPQLKSATPVTTLGQNLVRLVVAIMGFLLVLNVLGVSITPLLTALGVGGLAVALGLQETLANLFAGFFVSVAGHVRVGDYIRLNSGEEGRVADISWRATTLQTLANNLVVVPNSRLAQALVTNFSLPDPRLAVSVAVTVVPASDPDVVERVLGEEAARAVDEVPGLLPDPPPAVRFAPGFAETGLAFTVSVHVAEFADQFRVQHELRKRIYRRLQAEGVALAVLPRLAVASEQRER